MSPPERAGHIAPEPAGFTSRAGGSPHPRRSVGGGVDPAVSLPRALDSEVLVCEARSRRCSSDAASWVRQCVLQGVPQSFRCRSGGQVAPIPRQQLGHRPDIQSNYTTLHRHRFGGGVAERLPAAAGHTGHCGPPVEIGHRLGFHFPENPHPRSEAEFVHEAFQTRTSPSVSSHLQAASVQIAQGAENEVQALLRLQTADEGDEI